jgi:hypothetical protein
MYGGFANPYISAFSERCSQAFCSIENKAASCLPTKEDHIILPERVQNVFD